MIITVTAGEPVEVPANATFDIEFQTPWTEEELAQAQEIVVEYEDPDHGDGQLEAVAVGTAVVLHVVPGMLPKTGLWELNPAVRFSEDDSDIRRHVFALPVNVISNRVSRFNRVKVYSPQ